MFNEAFLDGNSEHIKELVTEDMKWTSISLLHIQGSTDFLAELEKRKVDGKKELVISNFITHGTSAAIGGTMKMTPLSSEAKMFAFCNIYRLNKFKDGKIKEITSYVIDVSTRWQLTLFLSNDRFLFLVDRFFMKVDRLSWKVDRFFI